MVNSQFIGSTDIEGSTCSVLGRNFNTGDGLESLIPIDGGRSVGGKNEFLAYSRSLDVGSVDFNDPGGYVRRSPAWSYGKSPWNVRISNPLRDDRAGGTGSDVGGDCVGISSAYLLSGLGVPERIRVQVLVMYRTVRLARVTIRSMSYCHKISYRLSASPKGDLSGLNL